MNLQSLPSYVYCLFFYLNAYCLRFLEIQNYIYKNQKKTPHNFPIDEYLICQAKHIDIHIFLVIISFLCMHVSPLCKLKRIYVC